LNIYAGIAELSAAAKASHISMLIFMIVDKNTPLGRIFIPHHAGGLGYA